MSLQNNVVEQQLKGQSNTPYNAVSKSWNAENGDIWNVKGAESILRVRKEERRTNRPHHLDMI